MAMKEQHTFSFEHEGHDIDATINYTLVLDDYGVPGSPTFWSIGDIEWEPFEIDLHKYEDYEIEAIWSKEFYADLVDHCDWLLQNKSHELTQ